MGGGIVEVEMEMEMGMETAVGVMVEVRRVLLWVKNANGVVLLRVGQVLPVLLLVVVLALTPTPTLPLTRLRQTNLKQYNNQLHLQLHLEGGLTNLNRQRPRHLHRQA